jgi:predicted phosphodiesterase
MKILVISDVVMWKDYEEIVKKNRPDVIVLAGDLTSDGYANFDEIIEQIPEYQNELKKLNIMFKRHEGITEYQWIKKPKEYENISVLKVVHELERKYIGSKEFLHKRKEMHVDKFYQFLEFAGKKAQVLVIKGDHDEDYEGDYNPERIDKINGCREISGKYVMINGLSFLGLGYNETRNTKTLTSYINKFKGKVDIVVTHCQQNRLPMISLLRAKIIIRGHFGYGKYLINGIPSVFTALAKYTIIELENGKLLNIIQYADPHKPQFSRSFEKSLFEKYRWLEQYPY